MSKNRKILCVLGAVFGAIGAVFFITEATNIAGGAEPSAATLQSSVLGAAFLVLCGVFIAAELVLGGLEDREEAREKKARN